MMANQSLNENVIGRIRISIQIREINFISMEIIHHTLTPRMVNYSIGN